MNKRCTKPLKRLLWLSLFVLAKTEIAQPRLSLYNSAKMKRSEVKAEVQREIGSMLTNTQDGTYNKQVDFGKFSCYRETFEHFVIVERNFETSGESLNIPFSSNDSCIQMIFSFDGESFFNKKHHPLILGRSSHSINFFHRYDCTNLLDDHAKQHDITFRLKKSFYADLVAQHLSTQEDVLPAMIVREKEFNTINQHLPIDAAVAGIVQNIRSCPFSGEMRNVFLKEHIRALFTLQLFHFNSIVTGDQAKPEEQISPADCERLHAVKNYIDQHFLNPASLESLCKNFALNEFKLKHGFKLLFDTSPIRYLQHKRLMYALSLLRDTQKTIKEISHEIGYSHPANFTTAFVKAFGKPPQHYRYSVEAM